MGAAAVDVMGGEGGMMTAKENEEEEKEAQRKRAAQLETIVDYCI